MVAFLLFGAALVPCLVSWRVRRPWLIVHLLVVQSVAGLTMVAIAGNGTIAATLVIVAAEVASIFPMSVTWPWIAVQTAAITAIWSRFEGLGAVAVGGAFAGFQVFAASTVALARSEREAREELGRANAELHATRSLLEENSRISERVRIARDLHGLNLADAVSALTRAAGTLHIHLDMPESVEVDDAAQAHALLRCIQEVITNAARHAAAQNLWIRVERRADGIAIHARDDGRGTAEVTWGNGLKGMRERFEEHAGRVEITSGAGRGFEVHGFMPRAEAAP
jgi:signal transduction histidine kinase